MDLLVATGETLYMSVASLFFSYVLGLPLGVLTCETDTDGLFPNRVVHAILNVIIGAGRAIPFTILMVLVLPLTRLLVGTGVGTTATIVPLTLAATPFVARTIEQSLEQVTYDVVQSAKIDNAPILKIIIKIKLGSRLFDIVNSLGLTSIAIISYTAMAGTLGGGGLGNYALVYGYYRYDWWKVAQATVIVIVIVCIFQWGFKLLSKPLDWRRKV